MNLLGWSEVLLDRHARAGQRNCGKDSNNCHMDEAALYIWNSDNNNNVVFHEKKRKFQQIKLPQIVFLFLLLLLFRGTTARRNNRLIASLASIELQLFALSSQ